MEGTGCTVFPQPLRPPLRVPVGAEEGVIPLTQVGVDHAWVGGVGGWVGGCAELCAWVGVRV